MCVCMAESTASTAGHAPPLSFSRRAAAVARAQHRRSLDQLNEENLLFWLKLFSHFKKKKRCHRRTSQGSSWVPLRCTSGSLTTQLGSRMYICALWLGGWPTHEITIRLKRWWLGRPSCPTSSPAGRRMTPGSTTASPLPGAAPPLGCGPHPIRNHARAPGWQLNAAPARRGSQQASKHKVRGGPPLGCTGRALPQRCRRRCQPAASPPLPARPPPLAPLTWPPLWCICQMAGCHSAWPLSLPSSPWL